MRKSSIFTVSVLLIVFSFLLNFIPYQVYSSTQNLGLETNEVISVLIMGILGALSLINFKSLASVDAFWNDLVGIFYDISIQEGANNFDVKNFKIFIFGVVIGILMLIWLFIGIFSSLFWMIFAIIQRKFIVLFLMALAFIAFVSLIVALNINEFDLSNREADTIFRGSLSKYKESSILFSLITAGGLLMFISGFFVKSKVKK